MSFREKRTWISLLSTLFVWGYYFLILYRSLAAGQVDGDRFVNLFAGCAFGLIMMQIVLIIVASLQAPKDAQCPADERERLIELKAIRAGFIVLNVCVLTVAGASPLVAGASPLVFKIDPIGNATLLMANAVLLAVVIAELVKSGCQIVFFHRGR